MVSLLGRAFESLTRYYGTNGPGWLVSLGESIFVALFTLIAVGLVWGLDAMRKHWVASTLIALLVIAAQVVIVWGPLYRFRLSYAPCSCSAFSVALEL